MILLARNDGFAHRRIARELGDAATQLCQLAFVVEGAQRVQMLQSAHERLDGRRVEPVEVENVGDSDGLEHDADGCEIGSLDLGGRELGQFVLFVTHPLDPCLVGVFRVEAEAVPIAHTACTAFSLHGGRFADRRDDQALHARAGVEAVLLAEARVHYIADSVDGQRGLGHVRRQNDFADVRRGFLEALHVTRRYGDDQLLFLARQRGIERQHEKLLDLVSVQTHLLLQTLLDRFDVLLPREEHQNVSGQLLRDVDLHHRLHAHDLVVVHRGFQIATHITPLAGSDCVITLNRRPGMLRIGASSK